MKKAIKEIDFSKARGNKFANHRLVVVGDRRIRRRNPADRLFNFINGRNGRTVEIWAIDKQAARLEFLYRFGLTRMPPGFEIVAAEMAA